ncbi:MAG TPA: hypothetical protein VFB54_03065 [Burkholderiales bacterium]|nr:hypothetical protein [Burkholderiales bacterium]
MTSVEARIATAAKGRGLAGGGVVVIWNGIRDELREDFFEWHPREHMVERLSIPGFVRGRRCIALDGGVEFLTVYELTSPEVLLTDVYRQRLTQPTEWSFATLPGFTDNTRGACRILFTEGYAMGGFVATLRLEPEPGNDEEVLAGLREIMPRFISQRRITGAHLVRNDPALTGGNAGNQRGRVILLPDIVVLVEGSDPTALDEAMQRLLSDATLLRLGAGTQIVRGSYQLEYSIQNLA